MVCLHKEVITHNQSIIETFEPNIKMAIPNHVVFMKQTEKLAIPNQVVGDTLNP